MRTRARNGFTLLEILIVLVIIGLAIGIVVGLLATGLAVDTLAARDNTLIPLIWIQAILPGLIALWPLVATVRNPLARRAASRAA